MNDGSALITLTRRHANFEGSPTSSVVEDPSELELHGKTYSLPRHEREEGCSAIFSGGGGSKLAYDLGDGRAIAIPNLEWRGTEENVPAIMEHWIKRIESEKSESDRLRAMGFLTQDYRIDEASVEGHPLPVLVMPSFSGLAQQGMQVRDTKIQRAGRGNSLIFGSVENASNPAYIKKISQGLVEDAALLIANEINFAGDSINFVIRDTADTPPHDRSRRESIGALNQEVRLFLFDVAGNVFPNKIRDDHGELMHDEIRKLSEETLYRLFDKMLSGMDNHETRPLEESMPSWDRDILNTFKTVKPELAAQVYEKVIEKLKTMPPKQQDTSHEPPLTLPGSGNPEILTDSHHKNAGRQ